MASRFRWAARRLRRALTHRRCPHRDLLGRRCCYWHRRGEHSHHEHVGQGWPRSTFGRIWFADDEDTP